MSDTTTLECVSCHALWMITEVSDGNILGRCPGCQARHPLTISQYWSRQETVPLMPNPPTLLEQLAEISTNIHATQTEVHLCRKLREVVEAIQVGDCEHATD